MIARLASTEANIFCADYRLNGPMDPILDRFAGRIVRARRVLDDAYKAAGDKLESPTIGLCKRMVDRAFDLVAGAICVAHSSLESSTEVLCRATLEYIVNGFYVMRDRVVVTDTLFRYMFAYVEDAELRVEQWQQLDSDLSGPVRAMNDLSRQQRRTANGLLRSFLETARDQLNANPAPSVWPSVWQRFADCGMKAEYRTVYAALSAQTHGNAGDLVHEFAARTFDGEVWNEQLKENREFSLSMLWFCVDLSLQLQRKFARMHELSTVAVAAGSILKEHATDSPRWIPARASGPSE
jgi:hypothetical protein